MDTLFFLSALLFGWLAYNLYHPVYRQVQIATLSFVLGWLTGELALHQILLQAALLFLFIWAGAVDGFSGAIGFAIYAASWICMINFYLSGYEARATVDNALTGALGKNYLDEIPQEILTQFDDTPDYTQIKFPHKNIAPEVEVVKNIPFGHHGQKLDLYRHRVSAKTQEFETDTDDEAALPVLLQIHGGAWTEKLGSKNEQALPLMNYMAQRNWICVSIDYRLSPHATFPEHIIDCKEGLAWVKTHIQEYGGDPEFIVVTGGSAGGHLSSLLALTPNDPNFQPGFEDVDTTVQGAVPFYGVYDFTNTHDLQHNQGLLGFLEGTVLKKQLIEHRESFEAASPLFRIAHSAPPFLIIHGDKDTLVPVEEARIFAQQLKDSSDNPVAYAEVKGGQHAFDMFASVRSELVKHGVARFLTFLHIQYRSNKH
jgi:acetyl esterase/lipase